MDGFIHESMQKFMAKQIDNSLSAFARKASMVPLAVLSAVVLIGLFIGLATALLDSNWPLVVILVLSIAGLAGFIYLSFSRTRRLSAAKDQRRIDWETAQPEIQRQNLNLDRMPVFTQMTHARREGVASLRLARHPGAAARAM